MARPDQPPALRQQRRRSHITIDMPPELLAGLDRLARQAFLGRSAYVRSLVVRELDACSAPINTAST
jgi:metal-responsive CopG/Arc/MetJ family transcriptional regulator